MLNIIAAMTKDRVIGLDNNIPWHIRDDMKNFKEVTMGHPIIMGRKTYESIKRPLPGRKNIVISNTLKPVKDITIVNNLEDALTLAQNHDEAFIIGGERLYQDTIDIADRIYLSIISKDYKGDKFFPEFNEQDWFTIEYRPFKDFEYFVYERRR